MLCDLIIKSALLHAANASRLHALPAALLLRLDQGHAGFAFESNSAYAYSDYHAGVVKCQELV
jgi:hypothetical protein